MVYWSKRLQGQFHKIGLNGIHLLYSRNLGGDD